MLKLFKLAFRYRNELMMLARNPKVRSVVSSLLSKNTTKK